MERILARPTLTGMAGASSMSWSRDRVLYVGTGPGSETHQIWSVPAAGGDPQPVGGPISGDIKFPRVSPDGKWICYTLIRPQEIEIRALENYPGESTTKR
jgi:dipeptidyl aminopeptidase/acylaminoacyl peptidase